MENHVYSMELNREYPRIESGKGIYMYKTDGTEIIDGAGGPVAVGLGHGIKEISDAIAEQAQKIAYVHRDDCITAGEYMSFPMEISIRHFRSAAVRKLRK